MARTVEVARAVITLEAETKGLDQQLSQAEKSLGRTAKFVQDHPAAAFTALGTVALGAAVQLIKMADETNKALGVIADRVPGAQGQIAGLRAEVSRLAIQYGVTHDAVIAAMDATAKAGAKNVDDLLLTTQAAIRAGVALGKSGQDLVEGLDAALDIFGLTGKDATVVMAQFFAAAEGRTSVEELLDTVTRLAPAIRGTGLDLVTTTNALAALIDGGFKPGKQAIAEFTKRINEGGVQAIRDLAASVGGGQDSAEKAMDRFSEAVRRNASTLDASEQKAKSEWKSAFLELGSSLSGIGKIAGGIFHGLVEQLTGSGAKNFVVAMAAAKRESADLAGALNDVTHTGGTAADGVKTLTAAELKAVEASKDLSDEQKRAITTAKALSEEQKKQVARAVKEASDAAKKGLEDANKIFADIQDLGQKTLRDLLTGHQREMADLEATFQAKITDLQKTEGDKRVTQAQAILNQAKQDLVEHWAGIDQDVGPKIKEAEEHVTDLKVSADGLVGSTKDLNQPLYDAKLRLEDLAQPIENASHKTREFADKILQLADSLGINDDRIRGAVGNIHQIDDAITGLHDSISTLIGAQTVGEGLSGIIGAISAGALIIQGVGGVLNSLFGDSPETRARKELLKANNDRLAELRDKVGDLLQLNTPGRQLVGAQEALQQFGPNGFALLNNPNPARAIAQKLLVQILASHGLTLSDLEDLAKNLPKPIQLRNAKTGQIEGGALKQLLAALGAIEPTQFGNTLSDQLERIRVFLESGILKPEQQFSAIVEALKGLPGGAPAITKALGSFDVTTDEGRAGALAALRDLLSRTGSGTPIPTGELGGLGSQDFLKVLGQLIGLLQGEGAITNLGTGAAGSPTADIVAGFTAAADASAFPPAEEASSWSQSLDLQGQEIDILQQILDRLPEVTPLLPPPLPANLFAGAQTASGPGAGVQIAQLTLNITVQSSGNPEQDGQRIGRAIVDELLGDALLDTRQGQGINTVNFR